MTSERYLRWAFVWLVVLNSHGLWVNWKNAKAVRRLVRAIDEISITCSARPHRGLEVM